MSDIAIVRVRGNTGIRPEIRTALQLLNLPNQHNCVIVKDSPALRGTLRKVQGFVTFGVVDEQTKKKLQDKMPKDQKTARLAPPKKGFERKGIKVAFKVGGALGDRGQAINDLIARMI